MPTGPSSAAGEGTPAKRNGWRRLLASRFLFVSLLVHLLFLVGAAIWVVQVNRTPPKRTFRSLAVNPGPSNRALEHKVQLKQRNALSAPPAVKRATTIGPSKFALPSMPMMPRTPAIAAASRVTGMGVAGNGLPAGSASVGTGFANPGGALFMASIGGMKVQARRLAVALDNSASVAKYQADMQSFVQRTFKDSEVATFFSASFKTPRGGNSIGSVVTDFLNSPKQFDSIYVFSDFKTPARDQEEAWGRLKQAIGAKKVRLYLHVLQDFGSAEHLTPAVKDALNFANSTGGSVKIGPMPRM